MFNISLVGIIYSYKHISTYHIPISCLHTLPVIWSETYGSLSTGVSAVGTLAMGVFTTVGVSNLTCNCWAFISKAFPVAVHVQVFPTPAYKVLVDLFRGI